MGFGIPNSCLAARIYVLEMAQTVEVFSISFSFLQLSEAATAVITGTAVATTATTTISFSAAVLFHDKKVYEGGDELDVCYFLYLDCLLLGLNPKYVRPHWMILQVLPDPPPHPNTNILPINFQTDKNCTKTFWCYIAELLTSYIFVSCYKVLTLVKALEEAVPEDLAGTISNGPYKEREQSIDMIDQFQKQQDQHLDNNVNNKNLIITIDTVVLHVIVVRKIFLRQMESKIKLTIA
ncbi:hypothetical protein ACJX0J_038394 [Zea mays]